MRIKLGFIAGLISLFLFGSACFAAGSNNGVTFTDPLKSIVVNQSQPVFEIKLQSNPTTGFSWALKNYDDNLLTPVSHKFVAPQSKKLIGAPGYEVWSFRVKPNGFTVPQITSITMIYSRPWDEQGAQANNFRVVTKDDN